jgi:hypothetical protein
MLRRSNRPFPATITSAVALIAAALVLGGCVTGSSSSNDQSSSDLTPEQLAIAPYVNEVDKICERERTAMAKFIGDFETHDSVSGGARRKSVKVAKPEDVETYVKSQMGHLETQQTDIRKVKLPTGEPGKQLEALWKKADAVIVKVKKDPQAAVYEDPFQPVAKELKKLRFSQCFQPQRPETEESTDSVPDTTVAG